jgi:hypothetical protein
MEIEVIPMQVISMRFKEKLEQTIVLNFLYVCTIYTGMYIYKYHNINIISKPKYFAFIIQKPDCLPERFFFVYVLQMAAKVQLFF